jgi:hypothetical protein
MSGKCWRINPPDGLHYQVEDMARREGRSVANLLVRLVNEAISARRQANNDTAALVAMIKGEPVSPA